MNKKKTHHKLVTDGVPAFGQLTRVDEVNYLDAFISSPSGKALSKRQKKNKANQFCFIGIHHERYIIGLALVDLSLVGNCFYYIYDKESDSIISSSILAPFGKCIALPTTPNSGIMSFKKGHTELNINFSDEAIQVSLLSKQVSLSAQFKPSQTPMCLCSRTGYRGWVYMQKQAALPCSGFIELNKNRTDFITDTCYAGVDWTLGYMKRETFWNWSNINTRLNTGESFGLNLVCGVNDTSFTENACWLNDELFNLPLTQFDYDHHNIMQPWRIRSNDQLDQGIGVDLHFTPKKAHSDHTNAWIMASHFSQIIGTYSGTITLPNRTLELKDVWGLAEDHYAKW